MEIIFIFVALFTRWGVRVVEGACLENRCTGDRIGGSNPFPTAKKHAAGRASGRLFSVSCGSQARLADAGRRKQHVGLRPMGCMLCFAGPPRRAVRDVADRREGKSPRRAVRDVADRREGKSLQVMMVRPCCFYRNRGASETLSVSVYSDYCIYFAASSASAFISNSFPFVLQRVK